MSIFEDHILSIFMTNGPRETSPDNQGPDNWGSTVAEENL